jgi:hypothetical protein
MRLVLQKTKTIKGSLYRLSLITEDFYFYSNYQEGDENKNTLMYNRKTDLLISDNYFAYGALEEHLEKADHLWISKYLKRCYKNYKISTDEWRHNDIK